MNHETEILNHQRLQYAVNKERKARGLDPVDSVTRSNTGSVLGHLGFKSIELGRVAYVSGLGEVFEYFDYVPR